MAHSKSVINLWSDGDNYIRSLSRPSDDYYPVASASRVRGSSYKPYVVGSPQWRKGANYLLECFARANFERGR